MAKTLTSEIGNKSPQSGLTLVEVLIVIAILGVMASVVVLTLLPQTSIAQRAAQEFAMKVQITQRMAIIDQSVIGLSFSETNYAFLEYREGEWAVRPSAQPTLLDDGEGIELRWDVSTSSIPETAGGDSIRFQEPFAKNEVVDIDAQPDILFFPTGGVTGFSVMFDHADERWAIIVSRDGQVEVDRVDV